MRPAGGTLYAIGWRYLIRRPWQTILMILGITLGVAVVIAVDLANESASRAFDLSTDAIAGRATHQITGGPEGLEGAVYTDLKTAGLGVPLAPVVTAYFSSPQLGDLPMQLLGIDAFAEGPFRSYLGAPENPGGFPELAPFLAEPGAVLLSADLAERFGLAVCLPFSGESVSDLPCTFDIDLNGFSRSVRIVGLLAPTDGLSRRALTGLILADIATAQELTGKLGRLSYIDVLLPETQDCPDCEARLEEALPPAARLNPVSARTGTIEQMTAAFRLNLTALSMLALVVGLFLIYNTMTFSVVKRRPLFGTLRCLGVTRREVFLLVVSEALVIGTLGAALGTLLGIVLGQEAVRLVTRTINDLYFVVTVRGVQAPLVSLVKGGLLGVTASVLTAAFPAREAALVPPRAALSRSGLESKAGSAVRAAAYAGLAAIASGTAALFASPSLALSFTGTFTIVIGFAALTPAATKVLMRTAVATIGRQGLLLRMAPRNVSSALSRTSIAVAALMVAVSVTIGISLMVGSFRETVVDWLSQTLQGDVYISPPGVSSVSPEGVIAPEILDALESLPEVARIDLLRIAKIETPGGSAVEVGASNNSLADGQQRFLTANGSSDAIEAALLAGAVVVSEPLARRLDLPFEGGSLALETPQGTREFPIAGVYYDYGNTAGVALMDLDLYREIWNDVGVSAVALKLDAGADPDAVVRELQEALTPIQQLDIRANGALRANALEVFDRTFAITSSLQGLATLVAFIGVLSALLSLQLEKARELGVLRAIGLTARQLRRLVLIETGLMGTVAGLLAMPTGFVLSLILIYIINRRAFGWTLQLQVSALPFVEALIVALVAALLAGLYPAYHLGKLAPAEALRSE